MFDEVFKAAGFRVVLTAPQAPRMHATMEWFTKRDRLGGLLHEYSQVA